jgi:hypothetical protein
MNAEQLFTRLPSPISGQPPAISSSTIVNSPRPFQSSNFNPSPVPRLRSASGSRHRPLSIVRGRSQPSNLPTFNFQPKRSDANFVRHNLQSTTFVPQPTAFVPQTTYQEHTPITSNYSQNQALMAHQNGQKIIVPRKSFFKLFLLKNPRRGLPSPVPGRPSIVHRQFSTFNLPDLQPLSFDPRKNENSNNNSETILKSPFSPRFCRK